MNVLFDLENPASLMSFAFFLALFLFGLGISQLFRQRSARRQLVAKIRGGGVAIDSSAESDLAENKRNSPLGTLFGKIGRQASALKSEDYSASRLRFLRAGIRHENALGVHWGVKIFFTVLFPAIFVLVRTLVLTTLSYQVTMA